MQTWHPDVRCFDLIKAQSEQIIGSLYTDLYVRKNKRGGAWMETCIHRRKKDNLLQKPVAFLTCNFNPPVGDQPALLSHDEVETLFHEFGHCLHHLLTEVDEMSVAGINNVAWDAVELPSQFLENWCWQNESLELFARHHTSGEPIPAELLEKMRAARNFQTGLQTLRQIEFSMFDMCLHKQNASDSSLDVQALLDQVRDQVSLLPPPAYNRFQNSFGHIFAGGYAAGYYSYKWSEVLSADAFSRFEEEGIFNADTGNDFKRCILARGGVENASDLFVEFRQRPPKIDALLRHSGLQQS
jgi:oligopeptidase A